MPADADVGPTLAPIALTTLVRMTASSFDHLSAQLRDRVDLGMPSTVDRLASLVRIDSVSWDAFDREPVRRSAERVRELFEATGLFDEIDVFEHEIEPGVTGQPGIVATKRAADGAPTVLLYAHHDVQPPGDPAKWATPAFEPTIIGDRLYGRGASDDKAGVILHLAALEALRDIVEANGQAFPLGISLFIEGEEENGSRSFGTFLREHAEALRADYIIVADSDNVSTEVPGLTVALRGNVTFNLTIRTIRNAWHSGMFGGLVPDAMMAATRLLATLWDEDGAVAVDGLRSYDSPVPDADESTLKAETAVVGEFIGRGPLRARTWFQPSITVTGIDAPDLANASNTLIPEVAVRISGRVAPGQPANEYADALQAHLRAHAPYGCELEFSDLDAGEPVLVDVAGDGVERMSTAMTEAWGVAAERTGIGGSIPFIAELVEQFPGAQVLVTGVEDPATMAHSPNESQHLGVLRKAIAAEALFLGKLNDEAQPQR